LFAAFFCRKNGKCPLSALNPDDHLKISQYLKIPAVFFAAACRDFLNVQIIRIIISCWLSVKLFSYIQVKSEVELKV
jgi:hypothetical protein